MWSPKKLFCLTLLTAVTLAPLRAELVAGAAFPDLATMNLEGTLPETRGHVVLVDFWASWCAPCKESFPALAEIHREYTPKGLAIVGVSVDEKAAAYAAFLKRHAPPFATVRDQAHKLAAAVKVPAMPTTVILGRDGAIRAVFTGYHGASTEKSIRAALDAALAETKS